MSVAVADPVLCEGVMVIGCGGCGGCGGGGMTFGPTGQMFNEQKFTHWIVLSFHLPVTL